MSFAHGAGAARAAPGMTMDKPNPMVQLMGGGALFTVAGFVYGLKKIPPWGRTAGATICVIMGVLSILLALNEAFFKKKKVEAPKYVPKRGRRQVDLAPETKAKTRVASDDPPGPAAA